MSPLGQRGSQGEYLYVANNESSEIYAYNVKGNGALAPIAGSPFDNGPGTRSPVSIAIDPNGKFVYVANNLVGSGASSISVDAIDAGTGALTPVPGSPFASDNNLASVAVDPSGRFVYGIGSSITAFTVDAASGALTPVAGSPYQKGIDAADGIVDPNDKFLFVSQDGGVEVDGSIYAYSINSTSGALTQVAGSPFDAAGRFTAGITTDARGKFVYVANAGSHRVHSRGKQGEWGSVSTFTIGEASGRLTPVPGSPLRVPHAGMRPNFLTVTPTAKFVFATSYCCGSSLLTYAANGSAGTLKYVGKTQGGSGPEGIVVDPTGKFVYVANYFSSNVSAYALNVKSGALTPVSGSPFAAGHTGPISVAACRVTAGTCKPAPETPQSLASTR